MSLPLDHPHIKHALLDTTMGYAAIYPEDVIAHHRAFIARRRTERPSEVWVTSSRAISIGGSSLPPGW